MTAHILNELRESVRDRLESGASAEGRQQLMLTALLDRIEESGFIGDYQLAIHSSQGGKSKAGVHAFHFDPEDDLLILFYMVDTHSVDNPLSEWVPVMVTQTEVDAAFQNLASFHDASIRGGMHFDDIDPSVQDLMALLREHVASRLPVEFHVLTNGVAKPDVSVDNGGERHRLWDLKYLEKMCGSSERTTLNIDFSNDFGGPLPCLPTKSVADGTQVFLAVIPGETLARIYNTFRSRLLERNVRSFLQFSGKVNVGIRKTVLEHPERFMSYNNGIAATASIVEVEHLGDGIARILRVGDFQIVNGGQTTASIAICKRKDDADLSLLSVPMKLTLVPPGKVEELVPLISRYANTQNRIQEADFSANNPWHMQLEKLSRETWTTVNSADAPKGTRWYYERSRGQYSDELGTKVTTDSKRQFKAENPARQKFSKTDLAKFVSSWDQRPWIVSRGAQKCFTDFMNQLLATERPAPTEDELKCYAAQALLFQHVELIFNEHGFTGYRAQVVTYSVATLSRGMQRKLPWQVIWADQCIPKVITEYLRQIVPFVRSHIMNPPDGRNISEWCKKEECWKAICSTQPDTPPPDAADWSTVLLFNNPNYAKPRAQGPLLDLIRQVPGNVWYDLSKWAKTKNVLTGKQRAIAYSMGNLAMQDRIPSQKQGAVAIQILKDAFRIGYRNPLVREDLILAIRDYSNAK